MINLIDLEKKINSELTTKIKNSKINHNQLYLNIDTEDLFEVIIFLKTSSETKFRQLIDITAVDYPENEKRFKLIYLILSHEFNQRIIIDCFINENEIVPTITSIFPWLRIPVLISIFLIMLFSIILSMKMKLFLH